MLPSVSFPSQLLLLFLLPLVTTSNPYTFFNPTSLYEYYTPSNTPSSNSQQQQQPQVNVVRGDQLSRWIFEDNLITDDEASHLLIREQVPNFGSNADVSDFVSLRDYMIDRAKDLPPPPPPPMPLPVMDDGISKDEIVRQYHEAREREGGGDGGRRRRDDQRYYHEQMQQQQQQHYAQQDDYNQIPPPPPINNNYNPPPPQNYQYNNQQQQHQQQHQRRSRGKWYKPNNIIKNVLGTTTTGENSRSPPPPPPPSSLSSTRYFEQNQRNTSPTRPYLSQISSYVQEREQEGEFDDKGRIGVGEDGDDDIDDIDVVDDNDYKNNNNNIDDINVIDAPSQSQQTLQNYNQPQPTVHPPKSLMPLRRRRFSLFRSPTTTSLTSSSPSSSANSRNKIHPLHFIAPTTTSSTTTSQPKSNYLSIIPTSNLLHSSKYGNISGVLDLNFSIFLGLFLIKYLTKVYTDLFVEGDGYLKVLRGVSSVGKRGICFGFDMGLNDDVDSDIGNIEALCSDIPKVFDPIPSIIDIISKEDFMINSIKSIINAINSINYKSSTSILTTQLVTVITSKLFILLTLLPILKIYRKYENYSLQTLSKNTKNEVFKNTLFAITYIQSLTGAASLNSNTITTPELVSAWSACKVSDFYNFGKLRCLSLVPILYGVAIGVWIISVAGVDIIGRVGKEWIDEEKVFLMITRIKDYIRGIEFFLPKIDDIKNVNVKDTLQVLFNKLQLFLARTLALLTALMTKAPLVKEYAILHKSGIVHALVSVFALVFVGCVVPKVMDFVLIRDERKERKRVASSGGGGEGDGEVSTSKILNLKRLGGSALGRLAARCSTPDLNFAMDELANYKTISAGAASPISILTSTPAKITRKHNRVKFYLEFFSLVFLSLSPILAFTTLPLQPIQLPLSSYYYHPQTQTQIILPSFPLIITILIYPLLKTLNITLTQMITTSNAFRASNLSQLYTSASSLQTRLDKSNMSGVPTDTVIDAGLKIEDLWSAHAKRRGGTGWCSAGASFHVKSGEVLCLCGEDGSGKTNILKAIVSHHLNEDGRDGGGEGGGTVYVRGSVEFQGINVNKWGSDEMIDRIGTIFEGGEGGNLELLKGGGVLRGVDSEDAVKLALMITGCQDIVARLPGSGDCAFAKDDADYLVEDIDIGGVKVVARELSTAERKRLMIANTIGRLIMKNAKWSNGENKDKDKVEGCLAGCVLLLDDVLAAFDERSEGAFFNMLRSSKCAVLVTCRRREEGKKADKFCVLAKG